MPSDSPYVAGKQMQPHEGMGGVRGNADTRVQGQTVVVGGCEPPTQVAASSEWGDAEPCAVGSCAGACDLSYDGAA
ncbi:hypothetical protein RV134_350611 [Roseovarius sp. EC-HK134]|nr:hypothetical protein RV134_350611 [Roseovarius sp. EC-HK134]VVT31749.1 hypothetical protein RV420_420006 [Roseovarius sp. EC-SD190]